MTQPIWYDSTEAGAPSLNNVAGSLLEVLRACLINGFGAKTVTSISVTGGVATATCASHGFLGTYGKLLLISGATDPLLNGVKQPGGISTNSFTYPAPGVPDGTYTGTMSARRAPLGWTETFSGTNKAMFARTAPEATAMLLRVDDTGTTVARVIQVESATDVDTYTGPAPTAAQVSGGGTWQKASSATANNWFLVGDDRGFWFGSKLGVSTTQYVYYWFGDGVPYYAADAYFCLLSAQTGTSWSSTPSQPISSSQSYGSAPSGSIDFCSTRGLLPASTSSEQQAAAGPNISVVFGGANNQPLSYEHVVLAEPLHVIGSGKVVRGVIPGIAVPLSVAPFTSLVPVLMTDGSVFLPVSFNTAGTVGQVCLRLSGGWR